MTGQVPGPGADHPTFKELLVWRRDSHGGPDTELKFAWAETEFARRRGSWARALLPMATHSSFLPGKFRGQRSLVGYSPWGHKESDMTEQLTFFLLPPMADSRLTPPVSHQEPGSHPPLATLCGCSLPPVPAHSPSFAPALVLSVGQQLVPCELNTIF